MALFNYVRLAITLNEFELTEQSLRKVRDSTSNPQLIAAVNQSLFRIIVRPGIAPPEFTAESLEGKGISPEDYKGKVLLIEFWATWCAPCLAELPEVQRVYEQYHDAGLEIVSISLDRSPDALEAFLEQRSLPWIHVFNAVSPRGDDPTWIYGVTVIPTMILVGRDGRIAAVNMRGQQLEAEIERAIDAEVVAESD